MNDATEQVLTEEELETICDAKNQADVDDSVDWYDAEKLLAIIDRLCNEIAQLRKPSQWVKCSERLPVGPCPVIYVWRPGFDKPIKCELDAGGQLKSLDYPGGTNRIDTMTHWHPDTRPLPPEDE